MIKPITKNQLETVDVPTLTFLGAGAGFLLVGVLLCTVGGLMDAPSEHIWNWKNILAGLCNIGLSIVVMLVALLYWWLVPRKRGALYPAFTGFGIILAIMALFSTAMLGSEFIFNFN